MRVTQSMMNRSLLENSQRNRARLQKDNQEVASGKKLNRPSDDPSGAARLMRIRDSLHRLGQFQRNIVHAEALVGATADALSRLGNQVNLVLTKGQQALSGTMGQEVRNQVADELDEIASSLAAMANLNVEGKQIFAGSQVKTEAVTLTPGGYTYQGDSAALTVEVEQGRFLRTNLTADEIFLNPAGDLLNGVRELAENLRNGDLTAAQQSLQQVGDARKLIDQKRVRISSALGELEQTRLRLSDQKVGLTRVLSDIEDADLSEAISRLLADETALQATLAVGARQQPNLFELIG